MQTPIFSEKQKHSFKVMKILLTGSTGQLGREILKLKPKNIEVTKPNSNEFNLTNLNNCKKQIINLKPDWIINCAAYTDVEKAEKETKLSKQINSYAPKEFSRAINKIDSNLLHISSDYVFDGEQNTPYKEKQKTNSLSYYGYTKALGEELIAKNINNLEKASILRTSGLLGPMGKNFVITMLKLHAEKETINVVSDQIIAPTRSKDLAKAVWQIIKYKKSKKLPFIMHWSDAGFASWFDIANEIGNLGLKLGILKRKAIIKPIKSTDHTSIAKRPRYSLLDINQTSDLLEMKPLDWKVNLENILTEYKKINF